MVSLLRPRSRGVGVQYVYILRALCVSALLPCMAGERSGSMSAVDALGLDAAALRLLALADVRPLAAVRRSIHQVRRRGL